MRAPLTPRYDKEDQFACRIKVPLTIDNNLFDIGTTKRCNHLTRAEWPLEQVACALLHVTCSLIPARNGLGPKRTQSESKLSRRELRKRGSTQSSGAE
jgi:hypothetical protein